MVRRDIGGWRGSGGEHVRAAHATPILPLVATAFRLYCFGIWAMRFQYSGEMFKSIEHFHQPDKAQCRDLAGPLAAAGGNASEAVVLAISIITRTRWGWVFGMGRPWDRFGWTSAGT